MSGSAGVVRTPHDKRTIISWGVAGAGGCVVGRAASVVGRTASVVGCSVVGLPLPAAAGGVVCSTASALGKALLALRSLAFGAGLKLLATPVLAASGHGGADR